MATDPKEPQRQDTNSTTNGDNPDTWPEVPRMLRESEFLLPPPWQEIFGPLRQGLVDDMVVVGQCGQSIDARIATASGHSHYINGAAGLAHLHRLRALVDAVVIGVGTALADDPQLTVRRVAGPNPARVVIDPNGRLATDRAAARGRWRMPAGDHADGNDRTPAGRRRSGEGLPRRTGSWRRPRCWRRSRSAASAAS